MIPVWVAIVIVGLMAVLLAGMWASFIATRLHRLNIRTDEAALSLDAALGRRAAVVSALWPELADEAEATERIAFDTSCTTDRALAENRFAMRIHDLDDESVTVNGARTLADAHTRVELAMRRHRSILRWLELNPTFRRRKSLCSLKNWLGSFPAPEASKYTVGFSVF